MSQRRSSSSASFISSSSSPCPASSTSTSCSSSNPSPSSSPSSSANKNKKQQQKQQMAINICPFGSSPSTSSSTIANEGEVPNSSSSSQPSPSKLSRQQYALLSSLYCPLLRPFNASNGTQQLKSHQKLARKSTNSSSTQSSAFLELFSPRKSSQREEEENNNSNSSKSRRSCGCPLQCPPSAAALELAKGETVSAAAENPSTDRRRRRRNAVQKTAEGEGRKSTKRWWRRSDGKVREVLLIFLLQFLWIAPYLVFANYLERCLLPLRIYCYTAPDLLDVRRALRQSPEACAAHFFASNGEYKSPRKRAILEVGEGGAINRSGCLLNGTLAVLLQPWRLPPENAELKRVIVIRSAPRSLEYRQFIRSSWKSSVERLNGPVIFVVGQDGTELAPESAEHGDILQLEFDDSYRNLTLKMMGIYRYFTERTRVEHIVVINDDTIVNATALGQIFGELGSTAAPANGRFLIGKVSRGYPRLVFPWLPWYVPAQLYPHKCYPPFVQGSSFIISRPAAEEVLSRVCDFPWRHIHLDDILMGIATNCLGIANVHRDGFDVGHSTDSFTVYHHQFSRYSAPRLMTMFNSVRQHLHDHL